MRGILPAIFIAFVAPAFGQSPEAAPKFEIADVHISAKTANQFVRTSPARAGRYEIKNGTMVDLIRIAYGFDNDKILGGPNWLELDRFDVIAQVPADSTADAQKQMLQTLLADRFRLAVHKETKPLPAYALTAGKQPKLKEADGSGETGCKPEAASGPPREGTNTLRMMDANGKESAIALGPGSMLHFTCRNMTMEAFAAGLRGMLGANVGNNLVADETGLKGRWNFDLRFSLGLIGPAANNEGRVTVAEALEKQLGLKLEQKPIPTPVIVVDSVNRAPSENPPAVAEALPTLPAPREFEVANVKPTNPDQPMFARFQIQPGGRVTIQGLPMRFLLSRAFSEYGNDQLVGLPKWADTERFDVTALAPAGALNGPVIDQENLAPMMRALFEDQFKLKWHTEERSVSAYSLVAAKPKLKKADPNSRITCKTDFSTPGQPPGTITLSCQNMSMAQLAERLRNLPPGFSSGVLDNTGIEGGWDFTLSFSQIASFPGGGLPRPTEPGQSGAVPLASDPSGGLSIFDAIEKQLGLKLEKQSRTMPVVVIDHLEQKPVN